MYPNHEFTPSVCLFSVCLSSVWLSVSATDLQGSEVRPVVSSPHRGERDPGSDPGKGNHFCPDHWQPSWQRELLIGHCHSAGRCVNGHAHPPAKQNGAEPTGGGDSSSTQPSSQLETTSFCSSEEDSGGRWDTHTHPFMLAIAVYIISIAVLVLS